VICVQSAGVTPKEVGRGGRSGGVGGEWGGGGPCSVDEHRLYIGRGPPSRRVRVSATTFADAFDSFIS